MKFTLTQCAWFGIVSSALALAPVATINICANHLASHSPSGVQVFLAHTPDQGETKALTQLSLTGETGIVFIFAIGASST